MALTPEQQTRNDYYESQSGAKNAIYADSNILQTTTADRKEADKNSVDLDSRIASPYLTHEENVAVNEAKQTVLDQQNAEQAEKDRIEKNRQDALANIEAGLNQDGSPKGGVETSTTDQYGNITYTDDDLNQDGYTTPNERNQYQIDMANSVAEESKALVNASSQRLIDSIQSTYADRMAQMKKANEALMGGRTQSGIRTGRSKYLQDTEAGFLHDEETAGLMRMSQLNSEMLSLVAQAENARDAEQITILNDRMDRLSEIDKELQDTILNQAKMANEALKEDRLRVEAENKQAEVDRKAGVERTETVGSAMAQLLKGATDDEVIAAIDTAILKDNTLDPAVLLNSVFESMDEQTKAALDIQNIESQISTREYNAQTARDRENRLAEGGEEDTPADTFAANILRGISTIDDVLATGDQELIQSVRAELYTLGVYEGATEIPDWFRKEQTEEFVNDPTESGSQLAIRDNWEKRRDKILGKELEVTK